MIGASGVKQDGWLSLDYPLIDITNNHKLNKYFVENSIDRILAEHVWEHLGIDEGTEAAKNCYRYLKPGGILRIAVPDGYHQDEEYIEAVKPGGTGAGSDDHKVLYNYKTLSQVLKQAGFNVSYVEYFDESGNFHATAWSIEDGLIRRSSKFDPRNKHKKLAYTSLIIDAIKPQ